MSQQTVSFDLDISKRISARMLSTLLKVSSLLAASLDLEVVLQTAIESTAEVLELDTGAIYLLEGDNLFLGATTPSLPPELFILRLKPEPLHDHPHLNEALAQSHPVYITDTQQASLSPAETEIVELRRLRSILYIPLLQNHLPLGALIVGSTQAVRHFTDLEVDLCKILSYQITLAIANARLFNSLQASHLELTLAYDATLLGWSLALDMRDQNTSGHTERVTRMTTDLAVQLGYPAEQMAHLRRGAMLHDIGKMGIPDTILKKTGPLTDEEWVIMRRHPEYAYQFLAQIEYLIPALDIPYCHHEKWDGSGYPRGLHGEEIPLAARIFAVVDVFDALTSNRYYRPQWQTGDVLEYIRDQADHHFEPRIAETFLRYIVNSQA